MTDTPRNLTSEELAALQRFATAEGRSWKHELAAVYWYNARPWTGRGSEPNDGGILHALRNDPRWGHHGLDLVELPKPATASKHGYELSPGQKRFVAKAKREGFEVDYGYSGRGMFGRKCPAVRCRHGEFGFRGASTDSMGLGIVVYHQG